MDEVLIGLGDAYETEAKFVRHHEAPRGSQGAARKDLRRSGHRGLHAGRPRALRLSARRGRARPPRCNECADPDADTRAGRRKCRARKQPQAVSPAGPRHPPGHASARAVSGRQRWRADAGRSRAHPRARMSPRRSRRFQRRDESWRGQAAATRHRPLRAPRA